MLQQKYRFHGHGSLRKLYQYGSSVRSHSFNLRYRKNPQRVHSRLTVIVAKKVVKSAVKRNRIRRRVYEVVRELWPQLADEHDYAITVYDAQVLVMSHNELTKQVRGLFAQAHLLTRNVNKNTK